MNTKTVQARLAKRLLCIVCAVAGGCGDSTTLHYDPQRERQRRRHRHDTGRTEGFRGVPHPFAECRTLLADVQSRRRVVRPGRHDRCRRVDGDLRSRMDDDQERQRRDAPRDSHAQPNGFAAFGDDSVHRRRRRSFRSLRDTGGTFRIVFTALHPRTRRTPFARRRERDLLCRRPTAEYAAAAATESLRRPCAA